MGVTFFSGIGGSGMSGIAAVLVAWGEAVAGSDRNNDRGQSPSLYDALRSRGIRLFPQDGSGISADVSRLVVSSAIEESNPEVMRARELGIPVMRRAELLAEIFNSRRGVAVGGTSGKSTVTAMIAWVFLQAGLDPNVINGARMKNFLPEHFPGNARTGAGDWIVIEADESDGTIVHYRPEISVITNITKDHKTIEELLPLFQSFIDHTHGTSVYNADCPLTSSLHYGNKSISFGFEQNADIRAQDINPEGFGSTFRVDGFSSRLLVPGRHNILNALATWGVARAAGIKDDVVAEALAGFKGIHRRFDIVGKTRGITVIDDFAHNPDKIAATLKAFDIGLRRFLVYQPHGYGPTRFLKNELINAFIEGMTPKDTLFITEIYYAGGTAEKTISGADLVAGIAAPGRDARFEPDRMKIIENIQSSARDGDIVIVMGARDDTLTDFCGEILRSLESSE